MSLGFDDGMERSAGEGGRVVVSVTFRPPVWEGRGALPPEGAGHWLVAVRVAEEGAGASIGPMLVAFKDSIESTHRS